MPIDGRYYYNEATRQTTWSKVTAREHAVCARASACASVAVGWVVRVCWRVCGCIRARARARACVRVCVCVHVRGMGGGVVRRQLAANGAAREGGGVA